MLYIKIIEIILGENYNGGGSSLEGTSGCWFDPRAPPS